MVTDYIRAKGVLRHRLEAVFAPDVFCGLYPQAAQAPKVYEGFPVSEPPFYAAVDEIVDEAETSGAATMGHHEVAFTLHVWLFARHAELRKASDTLMAYVDAVFGAVMADSRLNMTVDSAFPVIETAGTAADSSKRYVAASYVGIRCTVASACPEQLMAAVLASNGTYEEESHES